MDKTIEYYNDNATCFVNETVNTDMRHIYDLFLKHLKLDDLILDLGCGSGRDSKFFLNHGYRVVAVDGSKIMSKKASEFIAFFEGACKVLILKLPFSHPTIINSSLISKIWPWLLIDFSSFNSISFIFNSDSKKTPGQNE